MIISAPWGDTEFPDDMAPEQALGVLDNHYMQQQQSQLPPVAQTLSSMFGGMVGNAEESAPRLPSNASMVGMRGDDVRALVGQNQQQRAQVSQNAAQERMRKRIATEKAMEAEKDRAQDLSLAAARQKNEQAILKMREKEMEQRMKMEESESGRAQEKFDWEKQQAEQESNEPLRVGNSLLDRKTLKVLYREPESTGGGAGSFAPPKTVGERGWKKGPDGKEYVVGYFNNGTWGFYKDDTGQMMEATPEVKRTIETANGIYGVTNQGGTNLQPLTQAPGPTAQAPVDTPKVKMPTREEFLEGRELGRAEVARRTGRKEEEITDAEADAEMDRIDAEIQKRFGGGTAAPAQAGAQGGGTVFQDEASIPEGALVQDDATGKKFRKQGGRLIEVQ